MIRPATEQDRIDLKGDPSSARFLENEFWVFARQGRVMGFLAWRRLVPGESEILYLEIRPPYRRMGFASQLLQALKKQERADLFLEVRASNLPARQLYRKEGFRQIGIRKNYYSDPVEDGIVLQFHPC